MHIVHGVHYLMNYGRWKFKGLGCINTCGHSDQSRNALSTINVKIEFLLKFISTMAQNFLGQKLLFMYK